MFLESTGQKDIFRMARMRYQKGSLFLRGKRKPVWVGRWREDIPRSGGGVKRIHRQEILGTFEDFPSRRLALRLLDAKLAELNSFTYKPTIAATFKEFSDRWLTTVVPSHKPSSQVAERAHNNKWLVPAFGNMPLKHITPEVVQSFAASLRGLKPKSVRNVVATLRNMLATAKVWGYVKDNPAEDVRLPAAMKPEIVAFTAEQVQRILSVAKEPLKTLLWVAAETGMRGGELCGLRVQDVDIENQVIQVRQSAWRGKLQSPKTGKAIRRFALSPQLCKHLKQYLEEHKNDLLFPSQAGTPQDNSNVVRFQLQPLLTQLGLPKLGLHAFRHTAASLMDLMNVPLKTRQDRLGHSDPLLTLRTYTHAIPAEDREAAAKLGEAFCSQPASICSQVPEPSPVLQ